ncbi:two-component system sensor histidine kinase CreC [Pontiellaceae bacterium B12227]|nr:two-component system sensor histidine kinase CreC [Pontiellaceae bacterium B12227]
MKMRTRLLLTALVLLSAGFYLLVDWVVKDVRLHYFITMEEALVDTSVILAEQFASDPEVSASFERAFSAAEARRFEAGIYNHVKTNMNLRVLVVNREQKVIYDSRGELPPGAAYEWRDTRLSLDGRYGARASYEEKGNPDSLFFYVGAPILNGQEIVGAVTVGKPVSSITPFMKQARVRLIISGLIAFAAILLLLLPVSLWIIQPVRALTQYARAIRDGRAAARPKLGHGGEMSELANAFEEMRDTLEGKQYVEGYVQTLTHEMKSPLAAIQGAAELLDEEMTAAQRSKFISNIQAESERLHGLVERMLSLAAIEKRKGLEQTEIINLSALIDDVLDSLSLIAQSRNVRVEVRLEGTPEVCGEYFLLRQAVANLVQNAIDFSPQGGEVEVQVAAGQITVRDAGAGIPDYALNRVFERFYSLPRSEGGTKSSGLGLNFVREIARLHGGDVALRNRPEGGAEAVLTLGGS